MNRHSQQGSALLVVLGFLSFMVVSAVAFAIWMRTERVPSSALRRTVANRYLVKAALAQAMSRVDDAIRSHAFPGAWSKSDQGTVYRDENGCAYDWWESRVFMPPDPEGDGTRVGDPNSRYAPVSDTVSVLNLEALGYLPPAIANDVRLLARSSWAAKWDYFNFDAGRYAFCAVNVSDLLDINKMAADSPRTSAPAVRAEQSDDKPKPSRFSLAYLFRNDDFDFSSKSSVLGEFDKLVHKRDGLSWSEAPLVSLMDYNLALGKDGMDYGSGLMCSPFYRYVSGMIAGGYFLGGERSIEGAKRQPFVTDSWFPSSSVQSKLLDLSQNQPFDYTKLDTAGKNNVNFNTVAQAATGKFWETIIDSGAFSVFEFLTLFDYLDTDDVPISLAFPCVERVPMLTALGPLGGKVQAEFTGFKEGDPKQAGDDVVKTSTINMKVSVPAGGLRAVVTFPFKGAPEPVACEVQAFARLVFVSEAAGTAESSVSLRNDGFARQFRPLREDDWKSVDEEQQFKIAEGSGKGVITHNLVEKCLVVTLPTTPVQWTGKGNIKSVEDCWNGGELDLFFQQKFKSEGYPIIQKNDYHKKVMREGREVVSDTPYKTTYNFLLRPFKADGTPDEDYNPEEELSDEAFVARCGMKNLRPHLVAWARVVQDDKTVDMVPATYEDDKAFNGTDNNSMSDRPIPASAAGFILPMDRISLCLGNSKIEETPKEDAGQRIQMPILRFSGDPMSIYSEAVTKARNNDTAPIAAEWKDKACYAVDPRYNWAPENWWFDSRGIPNGMTWYNTVFGGDPSSGAKGILDDLADYEFGISARGDRANDPFLFVSNLGYLQSVGELAFLPRLTYIKNNGTTTETSYLLGRDRSDVESGNENTDAFRKLYNGGRRTSQNAETMPCALAAWKSYQNYRTNPNAFEFGANLYRRGLDNGRQDFYVNPFTQEREVMLAAIANTPLNYWVAATNEVSAQDKKKPSKFDDTQYKDFMFSDKSAKGMPMTGEDANKIALFLQHRFEDLSSMITPPSTANSDILYAYAKVWEDMFDALDWGGCLGEGYTVSRVYADLKDYLKGGGSGTAYSKMYVQKNGYDGLNALAKGNRQGIKANFTLNIGHAVYNDELGCSADPLRGEIKETKESRLKDGTTGQFYNSLSDVDRQFLHSYWRDCFANRQQLFLIFVRAESTALGGAGEGTPAQQGGRAVALVWRDPMAPTGSRVKEGENTTGNDITDDEETGNRTLDRHPHRMRILFYRQLD